MDNLRPRPNPQGKGLLPNLENVLALRTAVPVPAKDIEQISQELFTSLFVLQSRFSFKPLIGQAYWLYRKQGEYRLSMIAPQQWQPEVYGLYLGECRLQADLTWTLQLSDSCQQDLALQDELEQLSQRLHKALQQAESVQQVLPVYAAQLNFYPRVYAAALANSLAQSMSKSGILGLNYNQARALLD